MHVSRLPHDVYKWDSDSFIFQININLITVTYVNETSALNNFSRHKVKSIIFQAFLSWQKQAKIEANVDRYGGTTRGTKSVKQFDYNDCCCKLRLKFDGWYDTNSLWIILSLSGPPIKKEESSLSELFLKILRHRKYFCAKIKRIGHRTIDR